MTGVIGINSYSFAIPASLSSASVIVEIDRLIKIFHVFVSWRDDYSCFSPVSKLNIHSDIKANEDLIPVLNHILFAFNVM